MPDSKSGPVASAYSPSSAFQSRKAAQICAYFATRNRGKIEALRLITLVYLAERKFLAEFHRPMLFDEFVLLSHGPVCSGTLDRINGTIQEEVWDGFVILRDQNIIALKRFKRIDFDEVSDAELGIMEATWRVFGEMDHSQLQSYSENNCAEVRSTSESSPIAYRDVLAAVGVCRENAEFAEGEIVEFRREMSALRG